MIAYNLYWIIVSTWFVMLWYEEKNGHFMFSKAKTPKLIAPLETRDEVLIGEGSYVDEDNMARNNGASSSSLAKPRADVATEELVKLGST